MTRIEQAAAIAAQKWKAFEKDPLWVMQYLYWAEIFLMARDVFTGEQPLTFAIACGLHRPDALPATVWCDGHAFLVDLGWAEPMQERLNGCKCWRSLIFTGERK